MLINLLERCPGQVLAVDSGLREQLARGGAFPVAGTHYLLLRLPASIDVSLTQLFFDLAIGPHLHPVLIAPETHALFQAQPERLRDYYRRGARVALAAESLTGEAGPRAWKIARTLVEARLAQWVVGRRAETTSATLQAAATSLGRLLGRDLARRMTEDVPAAILADDPIDFPAPFPPETHSGLFHMFHRRPR